MLQISLALILVCPTLILALLTPLTHPYGSPSALRAKGEDRDMREAMKYLETHRRRPAKTGRTPPSPARTAQKSRNSPPTRTEADDRSALASFEEDVRSVPSNVFTKQTIWGQNIINCRDFNVDGKRSFQFTGSYTDARTVPTYPIPEIAFLGRSNVGKSSLLNAMTDSNKNIAIASKTPGRTRCINQFRCRDAEGDICTFVDLPGYGFAKMAKGQQEDVSAFLRSYLEDRGNLRLAVLLVDIRREPQQQDLGMFDFLEEEGIPTALVATKCDKLKPAEVEAALQSLRSAFDLPQSPIPFSSVTGTGRKAVWRLIRDGILGRLEPEEDSSSDEEEYSDVQDEA